MIEEDINERMARFAPSRNPPDPIIEQLRMQRGMAPAFDIHPLPDVPQADTVAETATPDPALDMLIRRRRERFNGSLYGAM